MDGSTTPLTMPPYVVIRPSGIWNTRAPFHFYYLGNRQISKTLQVLTLAACRLRYDAIQQPNRSGKGFLQVANSEGSAGPAWQSYRRTFQVTEDGGQRPMPTASDVSADLKEAQYDLREMAVVRTAALFETFAQSWALNYLLAKLENENGPAWLTSERRLAVAFSPAHRMRSIVPNWPAILAAFPEVSSGLSCLPHVTTNPITGEEVETPLHKDLTAERVIRFWRNFRNLVIHNGGIISAQFLRKNANTFEQIRKPFSSHMPPLERGHRLQFFDHLPRSMATTHYKAARWMTDLLIEHSGARRGHVLAPEPVNPKAMFSGPLVPRPLLVYGDDEQSLRMAKRADEV